MDVAARPRASEARRVRRGPTPEGPDLAGVLGVWSACLLLAVATWATNARTPLRDLYAVSANGIVGGAGRVVVLLGWPVALVAVAALPVVLDRFLAADPEPTARRVAIAVSALSVALCATIGLPGAIDQKDVDARWLNAPAAVGVGLIVALSLWTLASTGLGRCPSWRRADTWCLLLFAGLGFAALPWLLANVGIYAGDVPGLRAIFMSKQVVPETGYPHLAAVHLGNHDGLDGLLLTATAVVLWHNLGQMRRLREATAGYLALLVVYGLAVGTSDWWKEQVLKRGWTSARMPSVAMPSLSLAWVAILLFAFALWRLAGPTWDQRSHRCDTRG